MFVLRIVRKMNYMEAKAIGAMFVF